MYFNSHSMQEIIPSLNNQLINNHTISFCVLNPDLSKGYAGEEVIIDDISYLSRGYKAWVDLAELLMCKMLTPTTDRYPYIKLTFKKIEKDDSFHIDDMKNKEEKYGVKSTFFNINKMEEPAFLYYYEQALNNVKVEHRSRILNLGINRGDEFLTIKKMIDTIKYNNLHLVGIDHSKSAIEYAKERFKEKNVHLHKHDINSLDTLKLGRFNLLISIGTLQSENINLKPYFMKLVQEYLEKDSAIILGFPNSRWVGGEVIYGAKAPNYAMSEMSILYNDIIFCKKYLQQHKYRVTITGKQYIFLTATKILSTS